jgi:hypothetical protein
MEWLDFIINSSLPLLMLLFGIVTFLGGLYLILTVIEEKGKISKKRAYWKGRNTGKKAPEDFAAEQLKTVSRASFTSRALLNRAEAKVFEALDKAVIGRNSCWQVMAQVSLGEFLASPDKNAFLAVNSKRVDFALMDERCRVVHALEYQGSGHHTGNSAAARDAVKKEALRKAGIGYHEIVAGHTTPSELRALVEKLVPAA